MSDLFIDIENEDDDENENESERESLDKKHKKLGIEILPDESINSNFKAKILLMGDPKVGKTSIIGRLKEDKFNPDYIPTKNQNIIPLKVKYEEKIIELEFYDPLSDNNYKKILLQLYENSSIAILVYSICVHESFDNLVNLAKELKKKKKNVPLILLGNHCDHKSNREVDNEEGKKFAEDYDIKYFFEISAKNRTNLNNFFVKTIKYIYDDFILQQEGISFNDSIQLYNTKNTIFLADVSSFKPKRKRKCC